MIESGGWREEGEFTSVMEGRGKGEEGREELFRGGGEAVVREITRGLFSVRDETRERGEGSWVIPKSGRPRDGGVRFVSSCVSSKEEGSRTGGVRKDGGLGGIELRG